MPPSRRGWDTGRSVYRSEDTGTTGGVYLESGGRTVTNDGIVVTSSEPALDEPVNAALRLTAYPSPVAEEATLTYTLAAPGPVDLRIYDVLGREVARFDEAWRPAGTHRVAWAPGSLPAGIYVARLTAGTAHAVRLLTRVR